MSITEFRGEQDRKSYPFVSTCSTLLYMYGACRPLELQVQQPFSIPLMLNAPGNAARPIRPDDMYSLTSARIITSQTSFSRRWLEELGKHCPQLFEVTYLVLGRRRSW